MHADEDRINGITEKVVGAALRVGDVLGYGLLEKVDENASVHELRKIGLGVRQQHPVPVYYDGVVVGEYACDRLVQDVVLVELKSARAFDDVHTAQCLDDLTATRLPLCLLIDFGRRVDVKRDANMKPR